MKIDFGPAFRYLYTFFLTLSRDISIKRSFLPFWSLSRDLSIYGNSFLFGRFVQKVIVSCYPDSLVQNHESIIRWQL